MRVFLFLAQSIIMTISQWKVVGAAFIPSGVKLATSFSRSCTNSTTCRPHHTSRFLDEVETSIHQVFDKHNIKTTNEHNINQPNPIIESIHPNSEREAVGVAINLYNRIYALTKNNDCRRCWLQQRHCICDKTCSFESQKKGSTEEKFDTNIDVQLPSSIHRIFMIMHHKEIGMAVDTAKLLLNSFDKSSRLVVNGLDDRYQSTMEEFNYAIQQKERKCMVLFPSEDAMTFCELKTKLDQSLEKRGHAQNDKKIDYNDKWDVIVIDGTWSQARKMYSKYIPKQEDGGPLRVCLSQEAIDMIESSGNAEGDGTITGRQLRRHPIKWREISTLEATRLLIRDVMIQENATSSDSSNACYSILAKYQTISDKAAKTQLGPPRMKQM